MMGFYNMMGYGGWGFGFFFMLLFWILIIVGLVALVRYLTNQGENKEKNNKALDVLKERYARGEISKKEFEQKKKDLS